MQATIEILKSKLTACLDNGNVVNAIDAANLLTILEQTEVTIEALEITRLGLLINQIRKQNQASFPDLSKQCRGLIRSWQKLTEVDTATSHASGSNGYLSGSGSNSYNASPAMASLAATSSRTTTPRLEAVSSALMASKPLTPAVARLKGVALSPAARLSPKQPHLNNGQAAAATISTAGSRVVVLDSAKPLTPKLPIAQPGRSLSNDAPQEASTRVNVDKSSSPSSSNAIQAPIKLKIRIGGPCPSVTALSTSQMEHSTQSIEPLPKLILSADRKSARRKQDSSVLASSASARDLAVCSDTRADAFQADFSSGSIDVNGLPDHADSSDSSTVLSFRRSKSAAALAAVPTLKAIRPDLSVDFKPESLSSVSTTTSATTRPKLKTTLELVAEMTRDSPLANLNFGFSESTASMPSSSVQSIDDLKPRKRRKKESSDESVKLISSDLLSLESETLANAESVKDGPSDSLPSKTELLVNTSLPEHLQENSFQIVASTAATDAERLARTIQAEPTISSRRKSSKRAKTPKLDWYSVLPPLDLSGLDLAELRGEMTAETAEVGAVDEEESALQQSATSVTTSAGESVVERLFNGTWNEMNGVSVGEPTTQGFHDLERLVSLPVHEERRLLTLPYVSDGRPDFVEHKDVMPEASVSIVGMNYGYYRDH